MRLSSLTLVDFLSWRDSSVGFPERGLVVLTGHNGAGKSALGVDALPWVLWGESVRDDEPVPDGHAWAVVDAHEEHWTVTRKRSGRKTLEVLLERGQPAPQDLTGQTPTETQAQVDRVFGSWRRFAASRVFSRTLVARFSTATDKERKGLIEGLRGLEQFERAYRAGLDERRRRESAATEARTRLDVLRQGAARAKASWEACPAAARPLAEIEAEIASVRAREEALARRLADLQPGLEAATRAAEQTRDEAARVAAQLAAERDAVAKGQARWERALGSAACPTCLRPVDDAARAHIRRSFEALMEPAMRRVVALQEEEARRTSAQLEAGQDRHDVGQLVMAARSERDQLGPVLVALGREEGAARGLEERRAALAREFAAAGAAAVDAEEKMALAREAVIVVDDACAVLGQRGARVPLLRADLALLSDLTNDVLARLRTPLRVLVSDKKRQASGKEVDDVSIQVLEGGTDRYKSASDGERARIDLAMVVALSRMVDDDGLIVFDEVFDALDDDGIEGVVELLEEMARERQVIVTTHNPRFVALLPAGSVWRVSRPNGKSELVKPG